LALVSKATFARCVPNDHKERKARYANFGKLAVCPEGACLRTYPRKQVNIILDLVCDTYTDSWSLFLISQRIILLLIPNTACLIAILVVATFNL
jgi:hypothetical protein